MTSPFLVHLASREARADEALAAATAAATLAAKEAAEMKAPGWFQPAMGLFENPGGMVAWNWLYHIRIPSGNLLHFALGSLWPINIDDLPRKETLC